MTTEKTIVVHTERPDDGLNAYLVAYNRTLHSWRYAFSIDVRALWGTDFTAWYDPQIEEVERPQRYEVVESAAPDAGYDIADNKAIKPLRLTAFNIPTRSAAQRIADIYNEVAG